MQQYILAFDQGTTSSRALVFDQKGVVISLAQKEFTQYFPQPGWVEHDADEIWYTQLGVATEAILKAGLSIQNIAGIGITNQRETTVIWDRNTHKPIAPAIVWQDRRTATFCDQLKQEGYTEQIQHKTGLIPDAYFSATKIKWLLDNIEGAREKAEKGELCFGTVDSWLLCKLTNGKVHATDVTNASRTMLFNIYSLEWDKELLALFDIPESILPQVKTSSEIYGYTDNILTAAAIPICGIAGDQQAALFGQMCTQPGMVKNTYGTGCFMLMNTGTQPILSKNNLLTTIAWKIGDQTQYALEGSVFIAGAVVQWLRDGLGVIQHSSEVEVLASSVEDNGGVYFVPSFAGLGAPYWNQHAKGTMMGITRGTTAGHIARASIESIAFQTMDVLNAMNADAQMPITEIRVDGGATVNDLLMQFQSDMLNCNVVRPIVTETTAAGAAFLAGLAIGFWKDLTEIQMFWKEQKTFKPHMKEAIRERTVQKWKTAIKAAEIWAQIEQ
ncbi:MAG TPA: glycerol kinase GlpK [Flavisolibacter sp.]|nr:glycerol kinase GlpK [Flavisolibacter sp.]